MHFDTKSYFKNNRNHTAKQTLHVIGDHSRPGIHSNISKLPPCNLNTVLTRWDQ
jgi:bisphosphoglycerate-independent phosphoglycerate mutase (AlkP superfamily)